MQHFREPEIQERKTFLGWSHSIAARALVLHESDLGWGGAGGEEGRKTERKKMNIILGWTKRCCSDHRCWSRVRVPAAVH